MAYMLCGARKFQTAHSISSCGRQASGALQRASHASPVAQVVKRFQRLSVSPECGVIVTLFTVDVSQVCQGASRAPAISHFSEYRKRALVQLASNIQIALLPRNIAVLIKGPRGSATISKFFENACSLMQHDLRAQVITTCPNNIGKVVQTTRDRQPVSQGTPT